jgi:hypothetical protein
MSLAAITAVRPFLTTCFRSPLLAVLNSSSKGRMRVISSEGKLSLVSSASDMLVVDSGRAERTIQTYETLEKASFDQQPYSISVEKI